MEFDALKSIWQKTTQKGSSFKELKKEDILIAIEKKSNTIISKIRKRLKLKIWIQTCMGLIGVIIAGVLLFKGEYKIGIIYFIAFSSILALGIHKIRNYKMIIDFQNSSDPLRISLLKIIEILRNIIKAQIVTTVSLVTIFSIIVSFIFLTKYDVSIPLKTLVIVIITLIAPVLFYFYAKKEQQKIFGKYINTLTEYLDELGSENNHNKN